MRRFRATQLRGLIEPVRITLAAMHQLLRLVMLAILVQLMLLLRLLLVVALWKVLLVLQVPLLSLLLRPGLGQRGNRLLGQLRVPGASCMEMPSGWSTASGKWEVG